MYRETLFDCQALLPASQAFASLTRSPQSLLLRNSRCAWQPDESQGQSEARVVYRVCRSKVYPHVVHILPFPFTQRPAQFPAALAFPLHCCKQDAYHVPKPC